MELGAFPWQIQVDGVVYDRARFYATDDFAEVWQAEHGPPAVVARGVGLLRQRRVTEPTDMVNGRRAKWVLGLADGTTWLAAPTGGCGCGHVLKGFSPAKAHREMRAEPVEVGA